MPAKRLHARASRRSRRGLNKAVETTAGLKLEPQCSHPKGKTWMHRLLDLLKIGVGLANLIVSFTKY